MPTYQLGMDKKSFVAAESAYGTTPWSGGTSIAATDAIKALTFDFQRTQEVEVREDKDGSRSRFAGALGRTSGTWNLEKYLLPSSAAGTAPDDFTLWEAAFTTGVVSGGSSVDYAPITARTKSLSFYLKETKMGRFIVGASVDEVEISFSGSQSARVKFSGNFKNEYSAVEGALNGDATSDTTTLSVVNGLNFEANTVIKIESEYVLVGGVSSNQLTSCTRAYWGSTNATHSNGVTVSAPDPSQTTAGSIISGTKGSLSIGGTAIPIVEGSITFKNNEKVLNDEYGTSSASGYIDASKREVMLKFKMRLTKEMGYLIQTAKTYATTSALVTIGDTAGSKCLILLPYINIKPFAIPDTDEEIVVDVEADCVGSSGNDEITVKFQ